MIKFKRILFPTDFSLAASHALDYAISTALEHEASLFVVHVTEDLGFNSPFVLSHFPRTVELSDACGIDDQFKRIKGVVSSQLKRQINVDELVVKGKPDREIVRLAKEKLVDLIVMAAESNLGKHRHLGSVTERVVSAAPCAVLVIPPDIEVKDIENDTKVSADVGFAKIRE